MGWLHDSRFLPSAHAENHMRIPRIRPPALTLGAVLVWLLALIQLATLAWKVWS